MSKYGEVHDIFNQHHIQTKAKLDEILAKNSEIDVNTDELEAKIDTGNASLASFDGKVVACNTGAVVVSSSALPTDAATESSLAAVDAKIVACNTGAVAVASSALPTGAATESSLAAVDAKIVACNTGAVAVASSALPTGAADSAKQDDIKVLIAATNAALAGVLSVSAPAITKSSSTPVNSELIFGQSTYLSSEFDISAFKNLSLIGSSSDVMNSHEVDLLVSNVSGGTFFKTSHSGYYYEGAYHVLVSNHPYKYAKIQVKNAAHAAGMSATFIVHSLSSD
jgi:hypothetical protein